MLLTLIITMVVLVGLDVYKNKNLVQILADKVQEAEHKNTDGK